jgi:hypothetical protein
MDTTKHQNTDEIKKKENTKYISYILKNIFHTIVIPVGCRMWLEETIWAFQTTTG